MAVRVRKRPVGRVLGSATCTVLLVLGLPAGAGYAAADEPPALPTVTNSCVGPSPVPFAGIPWPVARLAPQAVWPLSRGAGVTVAVVDTGVSAVASGLAGAVLPGRDVVAGGPADRDCRGRGTALAGIVAARPVTGTGVVGLAPAVSVLPVRIVDGQGRLQPRYLADGIRAAVALGAEVILVGTGVDVADANLRAAVNEAVARDIVLVAAISDQRGASQAGTPVVWYPAGFEQVVAVGGIDADGKPTEPVVEKSGVDLVAPGVAAVSVGPSGPGHYRIGGAAVAAAYVAGAAALVRSYRPAMTSAEIRARLELTAEHPPGVARTPALGAGVLDPYGAVSVLDPGQAARPVAPRPAPAVLPVVPPADPAVGRAAGVGAAVGVGTLLALAAAVTIRAGRRRRWRVR
ncbi:S8 family serine peptidase [Micromonospora sp. NBC_01699]|uniref:S8 family serine peptidase n=1 Tax=Micromonospora sp. NBC_01699 TaxID=2975984 RepID=UPI002E358485|nr:S8 family serine peptidase [Micromonospora sp. NBC_01699]